MLLGHQDDYSPDSGMQVSIAFNQFGEKLVHRMPRCRRGYFHNVNNDYTEWEMYAIGEAQIPPLTATAENFNGKDTKVHLEEHCPRVGPGCCRCRRISSGQLK
ncbi:putative pectate lyase 12 [Platanthera zijinensis]|uniref:Pectate lyase n=1 Tax=Platanthera zijinensis TaxID=2320716 RepID=A0AAP0FUV4_9ASPA